jgi:methionyl-tRNA formyltransferase
MIRRVLFIGSKELGLAALQTLHRAAPETLAGVLTIDDAADRRSAISDFRAFATQHNVPLRVAANRAESEQMVRDLNPDLCIVVCWYWMLGEQLLESVPGGFIGVHNSLLPRYRGGSPLVWQLIQGETEIGFSIFTLMRGMDEGPIWAARRLAVQSTEHIGDVLPRVEAAIVKELGQLYPRILSGAAKPTPQDSREATYCMARHPEDGALNWNQPATKVFNLIRAQSDPYPGAHSFWNGKLVRFWRAKLFDRAWLGAPGQVARIGHDGVVIIAGDDQAVLVTELEVDGTRDVAHKLITSYRHRFTASER